MIEWQGWVVALAGVAVLASSCASTQGQGNASATGNPTAQRAEASQQESQQALEQATDAQRKAGEQARKATEAQQDVQKAQQGLVKAQEKSREEQQKAQEFQTNANQAAQQASRTTQQSQARASQALSQQGQQMARQQQSTAGQVTDASPGHVTVRGRDGTPMTFLVTGDTRVMVDGRPAAAADLLPGEDAQVAYQVSGSRPIALVVQVASGNPQTSSSAGGESASDVNSGTGGTDTGTSPAPLSPEPQGGTEQ